MHTERNNEREKEGHTDVTKYIRNDIRNAQRKNDYNNTTMSYIHNKRHRTSDTRTERHHQKKEGQTER